MTTTNVCLVDGELLISAASVYYTVDSGERVLIRNLTFTNNGPGDRTVNIYLVPGGYGPTSAYCVAREHSITCATTWTCADTDGHVLEAGHKLYANADADGKVALRASGVKFS